MRNNTGQDHALLHWREYGCELLGTCFLVFAGLSAVVFDFGKGLPVERLLPSVSARLLLTGLLFAGSGSLVAISPIGKLSGAHINPCVTLAFWIRRKMHRWDALLYMGAQMLGGLLGAMAIGAVWGSTAKGLNYGMTLPGAEIPVWFAFVAEVLLTFLLVAMIFLFVSSEKLMRKTPLMTWALVATMVWLEAPISGTSLNPARSLGPAAVAGLWRDQWLYMLAPPLGGIAAALLFPLLQKEETILTGKLFHSRHYPSVFKNVPHPAEIEPS